MRPELLRHARAAPSRARRPADRPRPAPARARETSRASTIVVGSVSDSADHRRRDVPDVLPDVVPERRVRIDRAGRAMHERDRPVGRLAARREPDAQDAQLRLRQRHHVGERQPHQRRRVRMLRVDERHAVLVLLADLKRQRIAGVGIGPALDGEHGVELEPIPARQVDAAVEHEPVGRHDARARCACPTRRRRRGRSRP